MQTPIYFSAQAVSPEGIKTEWSAQAFEREKENQTGDLRCGIPTAFGGSGAGSSPEDFYLLALLNCYVATLKVIAENSKLRFGQIEAKGDLTLDKNEAGEPMMKTAVLKFRVNGAENPDRFLRLMERVSKQCMILNSVKTEIKFEFSIA